MLDCCFLTWWIMDALLDPVPLKIRYWNGLRDLGFCGSDWSMNVNTGVCVCLCLCVIVSEWSLFVSWSWLCHHRSLCLGALSLSVRVNCFAWCLFWPVLWRRLELDVQDVGNRSEPCPPAPHSATSFLSAWRELWKHPLTTAKINRPLRGNSERISVLLPAQSFPFKVSSACTLLREGEIKKNSLFSLLIWTTSWPFRLLSGSQSALFVIAWKLFISIILWRKIALPHIFMNMAGFCYN